MHGTSKDPVMFAKIQIKTLLPLLFGLVVTLGIVQGAFSILAVNSLQAQVDTVGERVSRAAQMGEMERLFGDVRRNVALLLSTSTQEERASALAVLKAAYAARNKAFEAYGASLTTDTMRAKYQATEAAIDTYEAAGGRLVTLMGEGDMAAAKAHVQQMTVMGGEAVKLFAEMVSLNKATGEAAVSEAKETASSSLVTTVILVVIVGVVGGIAALLGFRWIARPITNITLAMNELADGNTEHQIPHRDRKDEIGDMAAAVSIFRDNAIERERLEREAEANSLLTEEERRSREEQRAKQAAEVKFAVDDIARGLNHLAEGDVTYRLATPFAGELDKVRLNFNESITRLQAALRSVGDNAKMIDAGASEIRAATEDLSKRTEQQAASVEETAAALEQVTTAVKDSATQASTAGDLVKKAHDGAERSGEIVRKAVLAMQEIEKSSSEIGNIIGVIDDIAFQTNLLALNAGVEAARAGDAGKGFAVVAQEVRELAQRSANAAKEIKNLITKSSAQVRDGVALVGETGTALHTIVSEVQEINRSVSAIVSSTREQSTGLSEINSAVNQMDQGTQKNASMVEETTAATYSLASQAAELTALLAQFRLDTESSVRAINNADLRDSREPSPARALGQRLTSAFG
jgi:methyl-accepting chemotaxis protein